MAEFSLDMSAEFVAINWLKELEAYFFQRYEPKDYIEINKTLEDLKSRIKDTILNVIKIYGCAILNDSNTVFRL